MHFDVICRRLLITLEKTRKDTKLMKQSILDTTAKYEVAHGNTADLLGQLTAKATKLEKLKAKLGMSTSLSAFLELNELKEESEDEEELLLQGTHGSGSKPNHALSPRTYRPFKCYVTLFSGKLTPTHPLVTLIMLNRTPS